MALNTNRVNISAPAPPSHTGTTQVKAAGFGQQLSVGGKVSDGGAESSDEDEVLDRFSRCNDEKIVLGTGFSFKKQQH